MTSMTVSYTLVTKVGGIIVKFKIMGRPNARTLKAYGRNFCLDNGVAGGDGGKRALHQLKFSRFGYGQYYIFALF